MRQSSTTNDYPYYLKHTMGCGKPAFWYAVMPDLGEQIRVELAKGYEGQVIEPHTTVVCGYCGGTLFLDDLVVENMRAVDE